MTSEKSSNSDRQCADQPAPLVIPRSEHRISQSDLDREALKVMHRLRDAGHRAYLVGGGVRDIMLGKTPKDFDISTDARPGEIRKIFRNSRIIGRRFRLVQVFFSGNKIVEVSTFRQRSEFDSDGKDKVLAANNTFGDPADDAFRRDLTINALFYEIENCTIIDYVGGVADLNNRVIRVVGDPNRRITRDPVRIMRVVRHAARTGFEIEKETWDAIVLHMDKLDLCPTSRIRDELLKDIKGGDCGNWINLALKSGLFVSLFPFYKDMLAQQGKVEESVLHKRLLQIFMVVDRLVNEGQAVPEQLILGLLLVPWAEEVLDCMKVTTLKGAYEVSRNARNKLEPTFAKLNIKRGMQDKISRCLATLPILLNHDKSNKGKGWPKWLSKKSYFNDGLQMFAIFQESQGGGEVAELPGLPTEKVALPAPKKRSFNGGRRLAFSSAEKGGVFGFRRW
jgi:poly(A) polymerase